MDHRSPIGFIDVKPHLQHVATRYSQRSLILRQPSPVRSIAEERSRVEWGQP